MNLPNDRNSRGGQYRLSYSLLAVMLISTAGASIAYYRNVSGRDTVKFNGSAGLIQTEIENRINLYVTLLAGTRGFVSTTPALDRRSFASYVENLNLNGNFPELLAIGFIRRVRKDQLSIFATEMEKAGNPRFRIFPDTELSEADTPIFIEPRNARTEALIGFDMASDPNRLGPMQLAARSGEAILSGKLTSIDSSEGGDSASVINLYLPVNDERAGALAKSSSNRTGYVYVSFAPEAFLAQIDKVQPEKNVAVRLYDGQETDERLLAASGSVAAKTRGIFSEQLTTSSGLETAGRKWLTRFETLPAFHENSAAGWTPMLFIAGTCLSLIVFGFTYRDAAGRYDLEEVANQLIVAQKDKERLYEQEQKARLEAEEANRVKDEFLAIVSHELKTPLNTIAGWASILKSDDLTGETKRKAIGKIEKNLRLQADLVEQLLSFSQLMADKVAVDMRQVKASEVFERATGEAEILAAEKNIGFHKFNELDGVTINADFERIRMALSNLFSNAVKFTPTGGAVETRAEIRGGEIHFTVKDNGAGIDPDFLPHIFEQFKQGDRPTVRTYGGLGLGLTIAKHIVELHNGTLESTSPGIGRGSQFTLKLPVSQTG